MPHGEHTTPAVSECGRKESHERERHKEKAHVERNLNADVGDAPRFRGEFLAILLGAAEEFGEMGARDVESLDHQGVHLRGEVEALAQDFLEFASPEPGRKNEQWDQS
jgi:hypothetical protein